MFFIFKGPTMEKEIQELCRDVILETDKTPIFRKVTKIIEQCPHLALNAWQADGIPILILQELVSIYYIINTENYTNNEAIKTCSILNLLQVMLKDETIKQDFLNAQLPFYLYPFLNVCNTTLQYENLRIAALGVVGTLIDDNDSATINYLKNTEIVPLTLKIMDIGSEVSKIIASNIFLKIINTNEGLDYVCQTYDRFLAINVILNSMVDHCKKNLTEKLLEGIIDIYLRLCDRENVRATFAAKKPEGLTNFDALHGLDTLKECGEKYNKLMEKIKGKK